MDIKENKPEFIEIKLEETSGQNSSNFVAEETSTDIENIGAENALDFL